MMIPRARVGVTILRMSRLVESLGFERIEIDPADQFPRKGPSPTGAGLYLGAGPALALGPAPGHRSAMSVSSAGR